MAERPEPVRRPGLGARRARERSPTATADLWQELLERLPRRCRSSGRWTAEEVRDAVAIDVPDEPMPDDELFAYLRDVVFELVRRTRGTRGSWPTSRAPARCPARRPTCSPPGST